MGKNSRIPPKWPLIAMIPPPGLARHRLVRAAHINISISDFADAEAM